MTVERLKEILDKVLHQDDLKPVVDQQGHVLTTYCNIALDRILTLANLPRMISAKNVPIMANDMCDYMRDNTDKWTKVSGDVACARASQGVLVVACQKAKGHGHVCCVYPMTEEFSSSWGKPVPMVANIGKTVGIMRASQAFRTEPGYYSIKI